MSQKTPMMVFANSLRTSSTLQEVVITPELAQEILDNFNHGNRKISDDHVDTLAQDMLNKKWDPKTSMIAFRVPTAEHGWLLGDGQHRLQAVVESGVTIRSIVRYDWSDDTVKLVDQCRLRDAEAISTLHGVPTNETSRAGMRVFRREGGGKRTSVTSREMSGLLAGHPAQEECGNLARRMAASAKKRLGRGAKSPLDKGKVCGVFLAAVLSPMFGAASRSSRGRNVLSTTHSLGLVRSFAEDVFLEDIAPDDPFLNDSNQTQGQMRIVARGLEEYAGKAVDTNDKRLPSWFHTAWKVCEGMRVEIVADISIDSETEPDEE